MEVLAKPALGWKMTEEWNSNDATEPSDLYGLPELAELSALLPGEAPSRSRQFSELARPRTPCTAREPALTVLLVCFYEHWR
ncbi:DUF6199 family natural product biosynthesis protein [Cohnella xylanilytica]|uniref:DUF6199 family natural product biosynthesis protein n=1 Tax=Cohnella xylanilytica TaxID=557555 RepID=UPI0035D83AFF